MKRVLSLIGVLLLSVPFMFVCGQSGLRPRGDVNGDCELNISDINVLVDFIVAGAPYHSFYTYYHDVDGDKEVNIADINLLIDAILGAQLKPMPSYSGTLPVLFINTEGHRDIVSKDEYLHANWWIDNLGLDGYGSLGSSQQPLGMQIKGHGNYTWNNYDKKSFRLKLDVKKPMMGMPSNRHWCLMAHPDDYLARLKNTMGFELSRRIGLAYTPAHEPVEVVLNGQYIGLYFLTEKIRVDKHRVEVVEQQENETNPEKMTGGWLLEIDNNPKQGEYVWIYEVPGFTNWENQMYFTHRSPEILSQAQRQWISQYLTTADTAIYNPDKGSRYWEQYIDVDTLAMYYIVGEIMDDMEYFAGSCYMYKHRGDSTKLIFGPVWDFGNAFQRWAIYGDTEFNKFIYEQPTVFKNHWIEEIAQYSHFQQVVKEHWQSFYESDFNGLDLDGFIDEFVESIKPAFQADVARWRQQDIEAEKKIFKNFIHRKIDWLNSQWGELPVDPDQPEQPPQGE